MEIGPTVTVSNTKGGVDGKEGNLNLNNGDFVNFLKKRTSKVSMHSSRTLKKAITEFVVAMSHQYVSNVSEIPDTRCTNAYRASICSLLLNVG
jgi:hypothetical protein